jgi:SAM-dependent methyltransferase
MLRARLFAALLAAILATAVAAQTKPEHGDDKYQPSVGQPGKDVIWVPTPDTLVTRMLTAAKVTKDDLVYDLGSGDGKIPIAAAKQFGAKAVGIEYNPDMADLARRSTKREGVDNMVQIITGDIFKEDFSKATVVTMYLLPDLNLKLRPIILKMKPGTRVTSHQFHMGDWEPDERFNVEFRDAYLWYVPADVAGEWTVREESGGFEGVVSLTQKYQKVGGTLAFAGRQQPLLGASLQGDKLSFSFIDGESNLRTARLTVAKGTMIGELGWLGRNTTLVGRKRPAT